MIFTAFTVGCEKGHSGMMKSFEAQGFLLKKAWRAAGWDVSKLDYLNASDANKLGSGGDK